MKYADPAECTCPGCGSRQFQSVADLLSLQATCLVCGSSLAAIGQEMREGYKKAGKHCEYVSYPIVDAVEMFQVEFPDHIFEYVRTKLDFVDAVVGYLALVAPEKANRERVSHAYDQSLIKQGLSLPPSETTPLV